MQQARSIESYAAIPMWQSSSLQCPLCGSRRRDYLFVAGQSRMTQCHECHLISRTGADGAPVAAGSGACSYKLDSATDAFVRGGLVAHGAVELLEVLVGPGDPRLGQDPRLKVTTAFASDGLAGVTGKYDAAFVNGAVEEVADPLRLLRDVRDKLRPDGLLWVFVNDGNLTRVPSETARMPCHVFSPPTLLRLARVAGFRTRSCGVVNRPLDVPAADARLDTRPPFPRLHRLRAALPGGAQVRSGLVELRAIVTEVQEAPTLTIVMPVFNEARTFRDTFDRIYAARIEGVERDVLIVESNSTDGSRELVRAIEKMPGVRVIYEDRPRGKGHAVRKALAAATGDIILIQDADSEYDVADYDIVLEPLLRLSATFVLGSRHMGSRTWKVRRFNDFPMLSTLMNLAHQGFTALANWLYEAEMRDPTTMYKVFRRECIEGIAFRRDRFDFDWELVCKLIRRGHMPVEVPINYRARSYAEGKKVRFFRDPWTWLATIVASRFESLT